MITRLVSTRPGLCYRRYHRLGGKTGLYGRLFELTIPPLEGVHGVFLDEYLAVSIGPHESDSELSELEVSSDGSSVC